MYIAGTFCYLRAGIDNILPCNDRNIPIMSMAIYICDEQLTYQTTKIINQVSTRLECEKGILRSDWHVYSWGNMSRNARDTRYISCVTRVVNVRDTRRLASPAPEIRKAKGHYAKQIVHINHSLQTTVF